jgi:hypothetical protein
MAINILSSHDDGKFLDSQRCTWDNAVPLTLD